MQETLRRLVEEEDGMEIAEWAIAATLVAIAAVSTITNLAAEVVNQLTLVLARLSF
jgi:Flp pilus assembly pilin Flp